MEVFDAQKTRKVLERVEKFLGILIRENLVKDAPFLDEGELENESDLADDVWAVLQMKPRNCDVGSAEEQEKRYSEWLNADAGRAVFGLDPLEWAQEPYEEGEAK